MMQESPNKQKTEDAVLAAWEAYQRETDAGNRRLLARLPRGLVALVVAMAVVVGGLMGFAVLMMLAASARYRAVESEPPTTEFETMLVRGPGVAEFGLFMMAGAAAAALVCGLLIMLQAWRLKRSGM